MTFRSQYQRSVPGGGRTVDTGPPRTNTGLTGLGAVGGATGVGAGALRVIVEFLTQYDPKEVERLQQDLQRLRASEEQYQQFLSQENATRAREQKVLDNLTALRARSNVTFTKAQRKELLEIRDLQRSGAEEEAKRRAKAFAAQTGFTRREIQQLIDEDRIRQQIAARRQRYDAARVAAQQQVLGLVEAEEAVQKRLSFLQNLRANVVPKLGSLALGAVGGLFGGALIGVGFTAAQALIDGIGQAIQGLVDPGKQAREILDDVAESIDQLADSEKLTILQATKRELAELGQLGGDLDENIIANAVAWEQVRDLIAEAYRLSRLQAGEIEKQNRELAIQQRYQDLLSQNPITSPRNITSDQAAELAAQRQLLLEQATREVDAAFRDASAGGSQLAVTERALAAAGDLAAASQDRLASAVSRVSNQRISGLQDQLDALGGPSANTQALTQQIEDFSEAQARAAYQSSLAQIQEQRALVLLEQRIRFQGESVRLDNLSARGQIVAINARIAALQRAGQAERAQLDALNEQIRAARRADQAQDERDRAILDSYDDRIAKIREAGEAQDRFNDLLDLQYRLGQEITRQEGESIEDFIQRRANETRQLLAEQDRLGRESQISEIQAERDRVAAIQEAANKRREAAIEAMELDAERLQTQIQNIEKARQAEIDALNQRREQLQLEVQLQELAEQEKRLKEQETARLHAKYLQEQLAESQKRDQEELKSRREAIEDQIEEERRRAEEATKWLDKGEQDKLRALLEHASTQADAQAVVGQVLGAARAYSDLKAYLQGIGLSPQQVNELLNPLKNLVDYAEGRLNALRNSPPRIVPAGTPFAKGGAFILSNSMSRPFGMDIRTGEEGQEIGVVLSNKVARILREQTAPRIPPVNLTINRSDDPWRDQMRARRLIRETMEEVLD